MIQLSLFRDYGSDAEIVLFPFSRRIALARSIANELASLDRRSGKKLWESKCRELRADLRSRGLSPSTARAEIEGLADAVHEELKADRRPRKIKRSAAILAITSIRRAAVRRGTNIVTGEKNSGEHPAGPFSEDLASDPRGAA